MTEKPPAKPPAGKTPAASNSMQAQLDSLFEELEGLDLGDGPPTKPPKPSLAPAPAQNLAATPELEFTDLDARTPPPARPREAARPEPRVAPPPAAPGVDPARVAALEQELEGWKAKAQRAASEFDNIRKRLVKEKQDAVLFANEQLARELLPVLDTLWLAVDHANPERFTDFVSGVRITATLFLQALSKHGVEGFDARGTVFDPRLHQALARVESRDVPAGNVVSVAQRGFTIGGRLLRPALVSVAGEPTPSTAAVNTQDPEPFHGGRRRSTVPDGETGGRVGSDAARPPTRAHSSPPGGGERVTASMRATPTPPTVSTPSATRSDRESASGADFFAPREGTSPGPRESTRPPYSSVPASLNAPTVPQVPFARGADGPSRSQSRPPGSFSTGRRAPGPFDSDDFSRPPASMDVIDLAEGPAMTPEEEDAAWLDVVMPIPPGRELTPAPSPANGGRKSDADENPFDLDLDDAFSDAVAKK